MDLLKRLETVGVKKEKKFNSILSLSYSKQSSCKYNTSACSGLESRSRVQIEEKKIVKIIHHNEDSK